MVLPSSSNALGSWADCPSPTPHLSDFQPIDTTPPPPILVYDLPPLVNQSQRRNIDQRPIVFWPSRFPSQNRGEGKTLVAETKEWNNNSIFICYRQLAPQVGLGGASRGPEGDAKGAGSRVQGAGSSKSLSRDCGGTRSHHGREGRASCTPSCPPPPPPNRPMCHAPGRGAGACGRRLPRRRPPSCVGPTGRGGFHSDGDAPGRGRIHPFPHPNDL